MPEIAHPNETRHVIAHDNASTAHVVTVTPEHVCITGQPTLDDYSTPADQASALLEIGLPDEAMQGLIEGYPEWVVGEDVEPGDVRRYGDEGDGWTLYKVNDGQGHTTQADWTPPTTEALWSEVVPGGVIPEWEAPSGAHDAYDTGDQVTHPAPDGEVRIWESQIDGNTVEPGTMPEFDYWTDVGPA